jgi:hypothetical protein
VYTQNLEARYRVTQALFLNGLGRLASTRHWEKATGAGGVKYRFWGETWVSVEGKVTRFAGSRIGDYVNWSAGLSKKVGGNDLEASLTWGVPSFTGYWQDDAFHKTLETWSASLLARF